MDIDPRKPDTLRFGALQKGFADVLRWGETHAVDTRYLTLSFVQTQLWSRIHGGKDTELVLDKG